MLFYVDRSRHIATTLQEELLLPLRTLQLIRRNLLQQLILVIVHTPVHISLWSPLSRRQEQAVTVHLLVREDAKETASSVGQGREFDAEGFNVVEFLLA